MSKSLSEIETLVREGKTSEAIKEIQAVKRSTVTRQEVALFANINRRLGKTHTAIKALRPFVRASSKNPQQASISEKLEYSMALIKLGAVSEGLRILDKISSDEAPLKLLYSAFGLISHWDYEQAAEVLEAYCAHPQADSYQLQTAKANLLSCYAFASNQKQSEPLVEELLSSTRASQSILLKRHILLQATQIHIFNGQWELARKRLDEVKASLDSDDKGLDLLLLLKWNLVLDLFINGGTPELKERFYSFRARAADYSNSEMSRDLDFYEALFFKDEKLMIHLYFGTRYSSYKEKIKTNFKAQHNRELQIPEEYEWNLTDDSSAANAGWLRIQDGRNSYSEDFLKKNQMNQKLLSLLSGDFYKKPNLYQIHDELFDEDFFNPNSTPKKIRQAVYRLNQWLHSSKIPVEVNSKAQFFSLNAQQPIRIIISSSGGSDPTLKSFCKTLKNYFSDKEFTSKEAAIKLDIPRRTISHTLKQCIGENLITQTAFGPSSKFKVKL